MASVFTLEGPKLGRPWFAWKWRKKFDGVSLGDPSMMNLTVGPQGSYGASLVGPGHGITFMGPGLGASETFKSIATFIVATAAGAAVGVGGYWAYNKYVRKGRPFAGLGRPGKRKRRK